MGLKGKSLFIYRWRPARLAGLWCLNFMVRAACFNICVISDIIHKILPVRQAWCLFEEMLEEDGVEWNDALPPILKKKK